MTEPTDLPGYPVEGLAALAALYDPREGQARRPPWNWAALTPDERAILAAGIDTWIETYNHVDVVADDDLIPPCWRDHKGLAWELAGLLWLWYGAYVHWEASAIKVAEYRTRYLPSFQARLDGLLGASPRECRQGQHPGSWRREAEQLLATLADRQVTADANGETDAVYWLGELHYGFPVEDIDTS